MYLHVRNIFFKNCDAISVPNDLISALNITLELNAIASSHLSSESLKVFIQDDCRYICNRKKVYIYDFDTWYQYK